MKWLLRGKTLERACSALITDERAISFSFIVEVLFVFRVSLAERLIERRGGGGGLPPGGGGGSTPCPAGKERPTQRLEKKW